MRIRDDRGQRRPTTPRSPLLPRGAFLAITRRLPIGRGRQGGAEATTNDAGTKELKVMPVGTTTTDDDAACNDKRSPPSAQGDSRG